MLVSAMPGPILILTGPEEGPFLEAKLKACGADVGVHTVHNRNDLLTASKLELFTQSPTSRLIAFCTDVIVPVDVLRVFGRGAYNFHPASPEYPGSNAASFAIYDQVAAYGVTVHEMEASVDSGAIIGFEAFAVPAGIRFMDLEILAFQNLLNLFDRLAPLLVDTDSELESLDIQWGKQKRTRRDFEDMQKIADGMSEDEIRLRWRAFG